MNGTNHKSTIFYSEHWHVEYPKAWFFSNKYHSVCQADFIDGSIEHLGVIPLEYVIEESAFSYLTKIGEKLFFLPDEYSSLMIYNLNSKKWSSVHINPFGMKRLRCTDCVYYNNKLLVYSAYLKRIICVNPEVEMVEDYYSLSDKEDELLWDEEVAKCENKVYYGSRNASDLYIYDLEDNSYTIKNVKETENALRVISCFDNLLWITDCKGGLFIYDADTFELKKELKLCEQEKGLYPYLYSADVNGYVWFIPYDSERITYVNKKTFGVDNIKMELSNKTSHLRNGAKQAVNYIRDQRYIGVSSLNGTEIIEIDSLKKCIYSKTFCFSNYNVFIDSLRNESKRIYMEDSFFGIDDFLQTIGQSC